MFSGSFVLALACLLRVLITSHLNGAPKSGLFLAFAVSVEFGL